MSNVGSPFKSVPHLKGSIRIIKVHCLWFQHWHLGWHVWQLGRGNCNTNILTYIIPTYLCSDITSSVQPPWALAEGSSSLYPLTFSYSGFFQPYVQPDYYSQGSKEDKEMSVGGQAPFWYLLLIRSHIQTSQISILSPFLSANYITSTWILLI